MTTTITEQALTPAAPAWPYPGVATVHALVAALGLDGQPIAQQASAVRQFTETPAWDAAPAVLQRDVKRWLGLLFFSGTELSITGQALGLAADDADGDAEETQAPDDPDAVSMATAHRTDDILHHLARASQRMQAARAATSPDQRASQSTHLARHLKHALKAAHGLADNLRAHYPAEGKELDAVADTVGLAKAVSDDAKAATTAHLTETTLHELAHAYRHAQQMTEDTPDAEWEFNGDHAAKHIGGALEHAAKIKAHLIDNYPREAAWLAGLDEAVAPGEEDGGKQDSEPQHARYGKDGETISAQMANPVTITGQSINLAGPEGYVHGWRLVGVPHGDTVTPHSNLGIKRAAMPQLGGPDKSGTVRTLRPQFEAQLKRDGIPVTRETVRPSALHASQNEVNKAKAEKLAAGVRAGDPAATGQYSPSRPLIVSSDNRVLDNHHKWAAAILNDDQPVHVMRVGMPARQALGYMNALTAAHGMPNRDVTATAETITGQLVDLVGPHGYVHGWKFVGVPGATDTLQKYQRPNGSFTPERAALHKQIVDGILAGHQPQAHPVATFLGGGPASGKSTVMKDNGVPAAHIDSDAIKAQLPEYQEMTAAGDPRAAAFAHEESSHIAKQAVQEAQKRRLNYLLDGTGNSSYEKMAAKVNAAKKAGYSTEGRYVTIPTDEAVKRAAKRAQRTGRMVPASVIRETHRSVSDAYGKAAKAGLFDKSELWDNSGSSPKLVAHKEPGGEFTVTDPAAWQAFLAKAHES